MASPFLVNPTKWNSTVTIYLPKSLHLFLSGYVASCWHLWATTRAKQTWQFGANGASSGGIKGVSLPVLWWVPTWDVDSDLQIQFQIWKESQSDSDGCHTSPGQRFVGLSDYSSNQILWLRHLHYTHKAQCRRIQAWIITFQFSGVWLQRVLSHGTWHTGDTSAGVGFVHRKVWGLRIGTLIPSLGWWKNDQSLCFCRLEISTSPEHSP